jgi:hypothetical protein
MFLESADFIVLSLSASMANHTLAELFNEQCL